MSRQSFGDHFMQRTSAQSYRLHRRARLLLALRRVGRRRITRLVKNSQTSKQQSASMT